MSLCPSSSHQLVAAAIAFRRARRKFPKDFGLESSTECVSGSAKAETATSREGPINQARSSSSLVKRACSSRSDHICPASVRGRDYDNPYAAENSISCSCCRNGRNGENISALRDECSGGDAIDIVPSREREEVSATSGADKYEFARSAERDRCDVASRTTNDKEAAKAMEWISQSAHGSTFYHHREARCASRLCSSLATASLKCDASREENDRVACGDSSGDKGKDSVSSSCHGTSIDFDDGAAEDVVTRDGVRSHTSSVEGAWTKLDALTPHQRSADSAWRCQGYEESHPCEEPTLDLLGSLCGRCCDGCSHRLHHHCDCFHQHCYQRHDSSMNAERCETHERIYDGRARHKSWRDPMRDESSRLYARHCYSKDSDIISAVCKHKDEEREKEDKDDEDEDEDDDNVAVINHKDSMCILAEKYKAGKRCRARKYEDQATRSADRTGEDECNKSLTSEIIDQPELPESTNAAPHEESSVKHVCRAHCESCGTAIANTCNRGRRHVPPEIEYERLKVPLSDSATFRCCSMRASCRRTF